MPASGAATRRKDRWPFKTEPGLQTELRKRPRVTPVPIRVFLVFFAVSVRTDSKMPVLFRFYQATVVYSFFALYHSCPPENKAPQIAPYAL